MAFKRTVSGISNQHLFHGVDIVVFVEGGLNNFTKEEVANNLYSDYSIDILFWNKLFEKFHPPKKIKFKAVGSKSTVIKIAEDIVNNDLVTVYAAMDKEFDEQLGNLIKHKNVLYSFGYSWENDAWNEVLIKKIVNQLTALPVKDTMIDNPYNNFLKDIKIGVYADSYQFSKNHSFFPRNGHLRFLDCNVKNTPVVKKDEINSFIQSQGLNKSTLRSYGYRKSINPKKHCYGHLFGGFCRHIIHHIIKMEFNLGTIEKEIIRRLAINNFINCLTPDVANYHGNQLR